MFCAIVKLAAHRNMPLEIPAARNHLRISFILELTSGSQPASNRSAAEIPKAQRASPLQAYLFR
jgi:hypothetical protein